MTALIQVQGVSKRFGEEAAAVQALAQVSLSVHGGELTLLMGPSGSGKTTLLSIMGCILGPSGGTVTIAGCKASGLSEAELAALRLRHIGFVFQAYNLFPTLTAGENVRIALFLKGCGARREQAQQALAEVGLADKVDTFPRDLSGGQKQRVAIARALAGDSDIILADEPTAALDFQSGRTVLELLRGLAHRRGCAVVVVTHDPRTFPYADRIVSLEDGRIVRDDRGSTLDTIQGLAHGG